MTTPPFTPTDGIARWRRALAAIIELSPGETITHDQLAAVVAGYRPGCNAVQRALRELRDQHGRSATPVVGVGYRILEAPEHREASLRHMRRGEKAMVRAHSEIRSADRSRLDSDEARVADAMQVALAHQLVEIRRERRRFR